MQNAECKMHGAFCIVHFTRQASASCSFSSALFVATTRAASITARAVRLRLWTYDTPGTLHQRIQLAEHRLFPEAIRLFAEGRLKVTGRTVKIL